MRHLPLIPASVVLIAAVSLLIGGCGGSSTHIEKSNTGTLNGALAYAHCMRSHGVSNFPDPSTSEGAPKEAVVSALEAAGNSVSQAAQTACLHVNGGSPGTGNRPARSQTQTGALLAFARCMRRRGLANFPDPTTSGQLTQQMLATAGINLHEPGLLEAADKCTSVTHGLMTKATVARFIAGQ